MKEILILIKTSDVFRELRDSLLHTSTKLSWLTKVPCRKWQSARLYLRLNTKLISLETHIIPLTKILAPKLTVNRQLIDRRSPEIKSRKQDNNEWDQSIYMDIVHCIDCNDDSSFKWAFYYGVAKPRRNHEHESFRWKYLNLICIVIEIFQ